MNGNKAEVGTLEENVFSEEKESIRVCQPVRGTSGIVLGL